jgi:anti-sigma-K factor RskA
VRHCDPDQLALAALSEPLPDDDAAHLAGCPQCQAEVDSLRRAVDVLSVPSLGSPAPAVPPPPRVWDAIAASTGVAVAPRVHAAAPEPGGVPGVPPAPVGAGPDVPVDLPSRRRRGGSRPSRRWLAVAAALLVGAGIGGGVAALARDPDSGGAVVAETALDPLSGNDASGSATVRAEGGSRVLAVDLQAPALEDAYYEVWLMESNAQLMVPVGVLHAGDTVLPLPDGLDLRAYPLVDVSVEPLDGVPTHSGLSVARGQLAG